jgi:hypothetical protein
MPETFEPRDVIHAQRAKELGASFSLRIVLESRRHNLPISLGFALFEQESGFTNVFGHDPTIFAGAGTVTRPKYVAYRTRRLASRNRAMQGVGPGQLTWWETQDLADRMGGCWNPAINIRVALMTLAARIAENGYAKGIERYNGSGPAARAYSVSVRARADRWHDRLA